MIHDATAPELATLEAFDRFLANFESGAIPQREWTHAAHIAAAAGYLRTRTPVETIDAVRSGIHNLLRHFGVETTLDRGYHESLTRLWVYACNAYLQETGLEGLEGIRALIATYGRRSDLHKEFYSFEVVRNAEARYGWVPPDLQALPMAWRRGDLLVSTNPKLLHVPTIHAYLKESYWAKDVPRGIVERSLRNSLCFGVYERGEQIGFGRIITDLATFAYLSDVFILEAHRGRKLSVWLVECMQDHPSLQGFRRWHLTTRDAHGLYSRFGFEQPPAVERHMEKIAVGLYSRAE